MNVCVLFRESLVAEVPLDQRSLFERCWGSSLRSE